MARARFIRPEFFTDEKIGELPFAARLLFIGSWCHADINGVLEWRAKQLRVLVFPHDESVKSVEVEKWMDQIVALGLVEVYSVGAATYGIIKNFQKHQTFTKSEHDGGNRRPLPSGFVSAPRNMSGHSRGDSRGDTGIDASATASATVVLPPVARSHDKPSPSPEPSPEPEPACEGAHAHTLGAKPNHGATGAVPPDAEAQNEAIRRNIEYLKRELRGRGMAASDGKAQEWVDFLKISCGMKLKDEIPILLDCIVKCAREAGISVVYYEQAGRFADAASRALREHRRALRTAQEQHEALLAQESVK